ncbi:MAG TPA: hypothetical protein VEL11_06540 [Candidatus Bathyarchaeia archaeon]|nr:hypothetical protein [Candidatus Bathyarchaeia archaeon]
MNKKIERLITAGMITALVAVFFYQVAYGYVQRPLAWNYGYMMGENDGKTGNGNSASACPDNVVNMTDKKVSNCIPSF